MHNGDEKIVDALAEEVTKGFLYDRKSERPNYNFQEPSIPTPDNFNKILIDMISHENIASKSVVYECLAH